MRAQVSVEFLLIIAVMMVVLLPVIIYAFSVLNTENQDKINLEKASVALNRIVYTIDSVGSAGTGSAMYTEIFVSRIDHVSVNGNELIFNIRTMDGPVEIYKIADYNIVSDSSLENLKNGPYKLLITAEDSTTVKVTIC
jgi:uncharacterized protein (UPF0333 family)